MGRCSSCGEDVGDDRVKRSRTQVSQGTAGIGHSDSYPGLAGGLTKRQPPADKLYERGVGVYGELARAWPGRCHVPRQSQRPAAQVQHPQRCTSRRCEV